MNFQCDETGSSLKDTELPLDEIDSDLIEELRENFLDEVFGHKAKLKREVWIEEVAKN